MMRSLLLCGLVACGTHPAAGTVVALGNAPTKGPATAKVTVVEFGDFECPFCGEEEPVVQQILTNYGSRILFAFKQFPLTSVHPFAQKAAEASLAANAQGQFWPYHDLLYANQASLAVPDLEGDAATLGLDTATFDKALSDGTYASAVNADIDQGVSLGVEGTPTCFVNGVAIVGAVDYATFAAQIDKALAAAK